MNMFGIRYAKFEPGVYALQYKNGRIVREGTGISFYYYAPSTSLMMIPAGSMDMPFIFEELTADYQTVTVQGNVTYRVSDPKRLAGLLNYTLDGKGKYVSEDPQKLPLRIVNLVRVLAKKMLGAMRLKEAVAASEKIARELLAEIRKDEIVEQFGLDILGLSILAVLPNKETARALEAGTREQILKQADEAVYERRNASIEQERKVRENEYNTEIAVENKRRQVKEAQLEAESAVQHKKNRLKQEQMVFETGQDRERLLFQTEQEQEKKALTALAAENARAEADAKAYELAALMRAVEGVHPGVIQSLAGIGMQPGQLIALAFQGLAENAGKIGELNISPELLQDLVKGAK